MLMKAIVLLSMFFIAATAALAQGSRFTSEELKQPVYKLLQELHQFGSSHNMLNVPPQDGRLLQMLVRMRGAKSVLEVGTSNGVSSIWMAGSAGNGRQADHPGDRPRKSEACQ